jgi:type VI secretion system protein ImpC
VARIFQTAEYAAWNTFRESDDARFLALTVPQMLGRAPYGVRPGEAAEFQHEESTRHESDVLWGSVAYAFGACVAAAFERYGWFGSMRGLEGGGLVEGLPTWVHAVEGEGLVHSSLEVRLHDRREKELTDLGFLPLLQHARDGDRAGFFTTPSCAKPRHYDSADATTSSRLSGDLRYVLATSRFVHYLKAICREQVGSYHVRGEVELHLNQWISQYVLLDDQASPALQVQRPLREARIEVAEHPDRPGIYRAIAFLRPQFQLDDLAVSLRVVADLQLR